MPVAPRRYERHDPHAYLKDILTRLPTHKASRLPTPQTERERSRQEWDGRTVTVTGASCCSVSLQARPGRTRDVTEYIVGFYNSVRLHSKLGYLSPTAYERNMAEKHLIGVSENT